MDQPPWRAIFPAGWRRHTRRNGAWSIGAEESALVRWGWLGKLAKTNAPRQLGYTEPVAKCPSYADSKRASG
jgi:hypothetical protein